MGTRDALNDWIMRPSDQPPSEFSITESGELEDGRAFFGTDTVRVIRLL